MGQDGAALAARTSALSMLYPCTFQPRFKERIWGGRTLETRYQKALPHGVPIGESWEISDRAGDESVIANGPFEGRTLRWLMEHHGAEVLGDASPANGGRFPLLCKILDAREMLSLQVHPPAHKAAELGGEPKTEMWYVAHAAPGAEILVGLKAHVTRDMFEARIRRGDVAACFHHQAVQAGDTMFLPSGRVHAIGAGLVIFEIQQNSDTTYRVFDWNRVGLDGTPRDLHIAESLASIDFADVEPGLVDAPVVERGGVGIRRLVDDPLFGVEIVRAQAAATLALTPPRLRIAAVVDGQAIATGGGERLELNAGQFGLVPASITDATLTIGSGSEVLIVEAR
jgi:mannose-6-phosphate isomerase